MATMTTKQLDYIVGLSKKVHGSLSDAHLAQLRAAVPTPTAAQASRWIDSLKSQAESTNPKAMIFDLDGTLADVRGIRHYLDDPKRADFHRFHVASNFVPANEEVVAINHTVRSLGITPIVVTARERQYRTISEGWLIKHDVDYDAIYTRPTGDGRPDYEVKKEILRDVREKYNPTYAADDNPAVRALWAEEGIFTFAVPGWGWTAPPGPIRVENPFVVAEPVSTPTAHGDGPKVVDGNYAVPTEDGHLGFYRVNTPTGGKWAGRTFVKVLASDTEHRLPGKAAQAVLAKIKADPKGAMIRFGHEMGVCGACGRSLTNESSREAGIGPVCASKFG